MPWNPVWWAACSVASPISHASGISATAEEDEQRDVARMQDKLDEDRDRREGKRGPEDLARHAARLPGCCARSSSTGATR